MIGKNSISYAFVCSLLASISFVSIAISQDISEVEPNNSLGNAQDLPPDQTLQAALSSPTDTDVYAVFIERESLLTLSFRALPLSPTPASSAPTQQADEKAQGSHHKEQEPQDSLPLPATPLEPEVPSEIGMEQAVNGLVGVFFGDTSGFPWHWRVGLSSIQSPTELDEGVNFFFGARNDTLAPQEHTVGLKPGLYTIQIGPIMNLPWIRNKLWAGQPYELSIHLEPASPSTHDIEPNNSLLQAQRILIGNEIAGSLMGSEDNDVFRFHVDQPAYVELHFSHEPVPKQSCIWQVDLSLIQGTNQEPIESLCSPGTAGPLIRTLLLEPGEYALEIHSPDPSNYSSKGYVFFITPREL